MLFIVHTPSIVLECEGAIPPGEFGRGYFNLHGDSPIGGHIKADRCTPIAFVRRPFMGRESCSIRSIQFFDQEARRCSRSSCAGGPTAAWTRTKSLASRICRRASPGERWRSVDTARRGARSERPVPHQMISKPILAPASSTPLVLHRF
jgi:hypothetical protein